jgi:hypothetical protein
LTRAVANGKLYPINILVGYQLTGGAMEAAVFPSTINCAHRLNQREHGYDPIKPLWK